MNIVQFLVLALVWIGSMAFLYKFFKVDRGLNIFTEDNGTFWIYLLFPAPAIVLIMIVAVLLGAIKLGGKKE